MSKRKDILRWSGLSAALTMMWLISDHLWSHFSECFSSVSEMCCWLHDNSTKKNYRAKDSLWIDSFIVQKSELKENKDILFPLIKHITDF